MLERLGGDGYNHGDPSLHPTEIQDGAVYFNFNTGMYSEMPDEVVSGDVYLYQDYMYIYNSNVDSGWVVCATTPVAEYTYQEIFGIYEIETPLINTLLSFGVDFNYVSIDKPSYGVILESINGMAVTTMSGTFASCENLVDAPVIPSSITGIYNAFYGCTSLMNAPVIPNGVINMHFAFADCTSLVNAPAIPNGVEYLDDTFRGCTSLVNAPVLPDSVKSLMGTFYDCTSLVNAPVIPNGVTEMGNAFTGCTSLMNVPALPDSVKYLDTTFQGCTSLMNAPVIPNSVTHMRAAFCYCTSLVNAPAIPNGVINMDNTFAGCTSLVNAPVIPDSVECLDATFQGCTSLVNAPVIPNGAVKGMYCTFKNCNKLSGVIEINATPNYYQECFSGVDFNAQNITLTGSSSVLDEIGATGMNYCAECNGKCKGDH